MAETSQNFEDIERELLQRCSPEERRMLDALSARDWERYQDAVTELYMQKIFRVKLDKIISKGAKGHGGKKPGSHGEQRHK